jgi:hypothetical protein
MPRNFRPSSITARFDAGPTPGTTHRRYSRIARMLDCAGRVGILVNVKMNVGVDHFFRIAGMRRARIVARVTR